LVLLLFETYCFGVVDAINNNAIITFSAAIHRTNCSRLTPPAMVVDLISAVLVLFVFIFVLAESVHHFQKNPPDEEELAPWISFHAFRFIIGSAYFLVPAFIGDVIFDEIGFFVGWLVGFRLWWNQFDDGSE